MRRVSLLVPEASADGLRQLAREFRAQHRLGMAGGAGGWRRVSPSAELLVDPDTGARCAIRDSRAPSAERYLWTVSVFGYHQWAAGRSGERGEARSQAEACVGGLRGEVARDAARWEWRSWLTNHWCVSYGECSTRWITG
jgi:hypothetical protein